MKRTIAFSLSFVLMLGITWGQRQYKVTSGTFGAIKAQHIGPAVMSGRIAAIDALQEDPRIVWVGSASGGVWKSKNAGVLFKPVFDDHTMSIGAVTITQTHPDTVWVGTGETSTRNSVSVGTGVYRTTDGGDNWKRMGLENSERVSRIIVHPEYPNTVYVAALGHLWGPNEERGVFKTTDGGENWEKVLYVDENTGCSDLDIDPRDPDILYAGMWDFRRRAYDFRSGGPGSALYRTRDGGKNWEKLTEGIPDETLGRIAVGVSPVDPRTVYALIEAKEEGGLYRSDNKGGSWKLVNDTKPMKERPFYFHQIYPDPVDTNRVYKPSFNLHVSKDKGEKFRIAYVEGGDVHVDHHALWISKKDNDFLYLGTDGGVYVSNDQGSSWRHIRNLPVSQFYKVSADDKKPYNVYGGLQDNGSWTGPSKSPGGITNCDWNNVGFGDGFSVYADKTDEDILYWQWQGGNFVRYYKSTGERKQIKPYRDKDTEELRFNWDAAIAFSPVDDRMYVGAQYLYMSEDKGDSWKRISPDLTTDDPEKQQQSTTGGLTLDNSTAENHCTIINIAESALDKNLIWVGTDDGNIQVTRDGGKSWTNVIDNVPGLPDHTWCSSVYPGRFDKGTCYTTLDGHRNDDKTPYVYKTTDYGETWTSLVDDNIESYCYKIIEDLENPDLLFLGTEFGLYVSIDGGQVWSRFEENLPKVSVMDLVIQPRENDLVLGTHGRGIVIIDDISPLRDLTPEMLEQNLVFLESRPYLISSMGGTQSYGGDDEFRGRNPSDALYITYFMKKRHVFGDMYIEIYNDKGEKIKELPAGKRKGINRVTWTPRRKPPQMPPSNQLTFGSIAGPNYLPGEYTVKVLKGGDSYESTVTLDYDPDSRHSVEERNLQLRTVNRCYDVIADLGFVTRRVTDAMEAARKAAENDKTKAFLDKKLNAFAGELEEFKESFMFTEAQDVNADERLREKLASLYGAILQYQGAPTQSQMEQLEFLSKEVERTAEKADKLFDKNLASLNKGLESGGLEPIKPISREEFNKEQED